MKNPDFKLQEKYADSNFLAACRSEPHSIVPIWFMRQAGRSLPEYRKIRGGGSILDVAADPERAALITLQPIKRYGVDAAILFSDIMVPVHSVGFGIDIEPGVGPVAQKPFESIDDLKRLRELEPEQDLPYIRETIEILLDECEIPIIGFAGAPFTVASYLIEGKPSRELKKTKALIKENPELWKLLMNRLSDIAITSLKHQINSGASAVQLFDTWAGLLDPKIYEAHVFPFSQKVLGAIKHMGVPRIHFGLNTEPVLPLLAKAGAEVVGVDSKTPIDVARKLLGNKIALQGNLDPAICSEPIKVVETAVADILKRNGNNPGHIFNLGHGVLPDTDPGVLAHVVEMVHAHKFFETSHG